MRAKSSNKKVVEASAYNDEWDTGRDILSLHAIKPGKAKVSYEFKGRRRSLLVVVKKCRNTFKSIKIGSRSLYGTSLKYGNHAAVSYNDVVGRRIAIKPKAGWRVRTIQARVGESYKNLKNRSKVPQGTTSLFITMQNKCDKGVIHYEVSVLYSVH